MFSLTNVVLGMLLMGMWIVAACSVRAGCTAMRISKPGLTGAMMVTLLAGAGAIACQFAVGMMMGMSWMTLGAAPEAAVQMKTMLIMPVWMLVCAMVYHYMLPTNFGKAMILFLAQALILGAMMLGFNMLASMTQQANLMEIRQMMPL